MSLPSGVPPIDFAAELNPQQHAAVTAPFGPALVLAGAGSGKTRTLTYRVAYLLSQGVQPWNILLLTFTNKAAREMLERVEALTGVERTRFWGGTFHHIGQKLLRQYGETLKIPPSFTILDQSEAESTLSEAVKGAAGASWLRDKSNPKVPLIASIISFARNTLQSVGDVVRSKYSYLEDKIDVLNKFFVHYTTLKRTRNLTDYDDLLELLYILLKDHPSIATEISKKFQHVLVDEYQDTNALQSAIIDLIAPHHRIMAVGDDAQCIYTWRGAEVENILSFPERHPGTQIYKIELNYRSTPPILSLANSVLDGTQREEFSKNLAPTRSGSVKPYIVPVVDGRAQANFIVAKVRELMNDGKNYSDIAILYRAHFHAMELQLELTRLGIPFSITSGMRFFEQAHVKDLISQLRFAFNPKDSAAFARMVMLLPKVGEVTALKLHADILNLHQAHGLKLSDAMKHEAVLKRIGEAVREDFLSLADTIDEVVTALAQGQTPSAVTHHALEGWYSGFIRTLYPNWDSRLDDLNSLESFANRFDNFAEYLSQLVLLNSEASDKSAEAPEDALRLSTVHQAKGLEYPVVFVIGLSESLFPGRRAIEENTLDEERRLFYVAVTRAQDELFLCYPLLNMSANAGQYQLMPSRFLEKLPADSFELLKVSGSSTSSFGKNLSGAGFRSGTGTRPSFGGGKPSFSRRPGTYEEPAKKKFDEKTDQNAKKLFNW